MKEQPFSQKKPNLLVPRDNAAKALQERIDKGRALQETNFQSIEQLSDVRAEQDKWNDYNIEYLSRCFDVPTISEEHSNVSGWAALVMNPSPLQRIKMFKDGIGKQITSLESILERLELIPEPSSTASFSQKATKTSSGDLSSVFIVHGHDDAAKVTVARFVEKLGLKAIILHEQPDKGQTIIEKFESNASNVGFAIVLLTPDDIASSKATPEDTMPRARQNVVLELGYFCGSLGRDKVCVLYKDEVEIPSDYLGVIYMPFGSGDSWHFKLAREMKSAGLDIDLNSAL
ncbi:nucleotide-binding protein containing TIR -like protein domain-like protein [Saccharophagus degradans 2-40]|uniref:Nucleotide-binding protein containing TIR-like protein domain-like protein n=2 Tax=Saccharophagus degradans TaxID=86304 RepID=Q21MV2_SACD2|nr:nucleotide-binding protein containing TIR -like protein domain-like protein [Saccharophagus degradans 2-40]